MNTSEKEEFLRLSMELSPFEQKDVLRYIRLRRASLTIHSRPPTAYEWNQLTEWQRKRIYYRFKFHVKMQQAKRFI
jgi:hypothetical protein